MGVEWVTNISMQFPDVPRPILPRRESLVLPPVVSSPAPLPPPPDEMRDPVVRRQMRQEMFEEGMRSRHVLQAQQMGFDIQDIENAVKRYKLQVFLNLGKIFAESLILQSLYILHYTILMDCFLYEYTDSL